ncbi:MAG TPA: tRNA (adenosine(37)-N6)-threonylcarbamoyltransferase complex ATPase subunit type 1 TsaE [Patescibacteria group bacterium]|nr:tRNA (adenosine(37)-N6)-threonylcarbamoyltransferase complex ATPase subunit type 1 TsaE [Patescibacteria group bacterium]
MKTVITNSAEETQKLGEELAKSLNGSAVITLQGDLGAGKTTFVQGFGCGLELSQKIISPTFLIIKKYDIADNKQKTKNKSFYHVDLYRLNSEHDVEGTGLLDILQEKDSIVVIEWPEKLGKFLPKNRIEIKFEYAGEKKRKITFNNLQNTN